MAKKKFHFANCTKTFTKAKKIHFQNITRYKQESSKRLFVSILSELTLQTRFSRSIEEVFPKSVGK